MQLDDLNSALSPVVYRDIALSINTITNYKMLTVKYLFIAHCHQTVELFLFAIVPDPTIPPK